MWYTLTPSVAGRLVVETDGNLDTVMELYDGTTRLESDDDSGNGNNARIEYNVRSGRSYRIKVQEYSNSTGGSFRIRASVTPPPSNPTVTSVIVSPSNVTIARGQSQRFNARVNGSGNPSQTVTWRVTGGRSGTSISSTGFLKVAANETSRTLTVTATSTIDTRINNSVIVTVTGFPTQNSRLNTIGVSVGTSFATPLLITTVQGTFSPFNHLFFELGMDIGLVHKRDRKSVV
jgi:hypothetical protein